MRTRRFWIAALLVLGAAGVLVLLRQGLVPGAARLLPTLSLERPGGLLLDWQLAALRRDAEACRALLRSPRLEATPLPDDKVRNGCGVTNGVRVAALAGARLPVDRIGCDVALALTLWMTYEVQPAAREILGQPVTAVRSLGAYACRDIRTDNPALVDMRSEHATGSAIDIGGFTLADGRAIAVARHWRSTGTEGAFLRAAHRGACRYFRVVLGPEFNALHRDHFHLDRGPLWTCR